MVERSYRLAAPPAQGQQFVAEIPLEIRFRSYLAGAISNQTDPHIRRLALFSIRCMANQAS
jgi:hypothetical protein